MENQNQTGQDTGGILYGVLAYTVWGVLPLYWKLLHVVPALEILSHRIIWSFVFVSLILCYTRGWQRVVTVIRDTKNLIYLFLCGFLISSNWFTYIWAVNSGYVIEASMGYYINPLVVFLLGVLILKEKLTHWQVLAIGLAAAGVMVMTIHYGRFPWIALTLAVTFAFYGLSKKLIQVDSLTGIALETAVVTPIALIYIINRQIHGIGAIGSIPLPATLILFGAGIVTATPLLWFAIGAKRVRFTVLGFLQYIAPTISLLAGVFIIKEKFTPTHLVSFTLIWLGLLIFIVFNLYSARKLIQQKGKVKLGKNTSY